MNRAVGLFGTCGNSLWRNEAIPLLESAGIQYFNPVVADWNEESQKAEVDHAADDAVLVVVITGETTGIASLSESGWIAANALMNGEQSVVFVIQDLNEGVECDPATFKQVNKARSLLRKYIQGISSRDAEVYWAMTVVDAINKAIELIREGDDE